MMDYFGDISKKSIIPPWCSGKVHVRGKPDKVTPATWEIRSSYPLRINIWEYLHDSNDKEQRNFHGKRSRNASQQTVELGKNNASVRLFFAVVGILLVLPLMPELIFNADEIRSAISKTGLISLLDLKSKSTQECCDKGKHLAVVLFRVQQSYRQAKRLKWNVLTQRETKDNINIIESNLLSEMVVRKGANTNEWGGQLSLWGVIPLWRLAPPLDIILASRKPTPADCWPMSGSTGEIVIELSRRGRLQHVSLEHVRPDTQDSAPKRFTLYSVLENGTWIKTVDAEYTNKGPAKQYYPVKYKDMLIKRVIFRVHSNHGNIKYTCIYRVHVYGIFYVLNE